MSANDSVNEFYDGSHILSPFISLTGLPIDQVKICFGKYFNVVTSEVTHRARNEPVSAL